MIHRGEIWWADLGDPRGSAPALRRPVIVLQSDRYNESRLRTVIVVAVTTNLRLAAMPGNVLLPSDVTGLPHDSVANVTQIATVDRTDLDARAGTLPEWVLGDVANGVRTVLSL